jgi:hypothetical protein
MIKVATLEIYVKEVTDDTLECVREVISDAKINDFINDGTVDIITSYEDDIELKMKKNTSIISGFPGIGKSYLFNFRKDLTILDSDSSQFSWLEKGVRDPDFPNNYMKHIKDNIGKVDVILVSSHDVVRQALKDNNIDYTIVYPNKSCKEEYLNRYRNRGNDEGFVNMINKNWDKFIDEIEKETFPSKIDLEADQYLKDIIWVLIK